MNVLWKVTIFQFEFCLSLEFEPRENVWDFYFRSKYKFVSLLFTCNIRLSTAFEKQIIVLEKIRYVIFSLQSALFATCACTDLLQAVKEVVFFSRFASGETAKWRIFNFPRFTKNQSAMEPFNAIFENNSP